MKNAIISLRLSVSKQSTLNNKVSSRLWQLLSNTKYAKHNNVRFRSSEDRENGIKMFNGFFESIEKEEGREL
jgi:hypothetical protein